jgi:hypothetical protein
MIMEPQVACQQHDHGLIGIRLRIGHFWPHDDKRLPNVKRITKPQALDHAWTTPRPGRTRRPAAPTFVGRPKGEDEAP